MLSGVFLCPFSEDKWNKRSGTRAKVEQAWAAGTAAGDHREGHKWNKWNSVSLLCSTYCSTENKLKNSQKPLFYK